MNLAARRFVQDNFKYAIFQLSSLPKEIQVAIVGGSLSDPEVATLKELGFNSTITTFGVESANVYLDLNEPTSSRQKRKFDLVLCSQVLEHVWNMNQVFENLTALVKEDGFIWIGCPTSNMKHEGGTTKFYSVGYQSSFVSKNLSKFHYETLYQGELGSERLYKLTHCKLMWPSEREYLHPIRSSMNRVELIDSIKALSLEKMKRIYRKVLGGLVVSLWNKEIEMNSPYATETFVFATPISNSKLKKEVKSQFKKPQRKLL
jgi:SAM-dependent methyltransferase